MQNDSTKEREGRKHATVDGVERSRAHNDGRLTCCPATGRSDKGMQKRKWHLSGCRKILAHPARRLDLWHHFQPRKQKCRAYAAERLVCLLRLRWIIQPGTITLRPGEDQFAVFMVAS